jgi:hypothetical protein
LRKERAMSKKVTIPDFDIEASHAAVVMKDEAVVIDEHKQAVMIPSWEELVGRDDT